MKTYYPYYLTYGGLGGCAGSVLVYSGHPVTGSGEYEKGLIWVYRKPETVKRIMEKHGWSFCYEDKHLVFAREK